jgi:hypothetical protein
MPRIPRVYSRTQSRVYSRKAKPTKRAGQRRRVLEPRPVLLNPPHRGEAIHRLVWLFVCLFFCFVGLRLGPAAVGCGVRLYRAADGRLDRPAVWPRWAHPPTTAATGPCRIFTRDWARPFHLCAGTGLTPTTSAPGLGVPPSQQR